MPGESFNIECSCVDEGTASFPTDLAPYVVSIAGLNGIVSLSGQGALNITTSGNTILFSLSASAGLGTVTQVAASSSSSNLVIGGTPINTTGTLTFALAGNIGSIAGLTMAADQMLYSTGAATFAATSLTAFGRSLIDDAAAVNARSTLGLVIGTNVQAWSADLDSFVSNASWTGSDLTLAGDLNAADGGFSGTLGVTGLATLNGGITTGSITAATITADGSGLTTLNASNISSGTLAVARGGTNIASYTIGDLLYASGATTLSKLADVAAGAFLRSGGVATAPAWSSTLWPNTLVTGDILYASSTTQVSRLADVATNNVLLSGGVGVAPLWGKVTASHTTGLAASGSNSDITALTALGSVTSVVTFADEVELLSTLRDGMGSVGTTGQLLTYNGTTTEWSNQIGVDTLNILSSLSTEATLTAGGTTGAQTINKLSGSVNFAAGASSLVVTNSLCDANSMIFCTVLTNDTTALIKNVVAASGSFTIRLNANATAETKVAFLLIQPS